MCFVVQSQSRLPGDLFPELSARWPEDQHYRLLEAVAHEHRILLELVGELPTDASDEPKCDLDEFFRALNVKLAWIREWGRLRRPPTSEELCTIRDRCLGKLNNNALRNRLASFESLPEWLRDYLPLPGHERRSEALSLPSTACLETLRKHVEQLTDPVPAVPLEAIQSSVEGYLDELIAGRKAQLGFTSLWWLKLFQWEFLVGREVREILPKFLPNDRPSPNGDRIPGDNSDYKSITNSVFITLLEQSIRRSELLVKCWRQHQHCKLSTYLSAFVPTQVRRCLCAELGIPFQESNKEAQAQPKTSRSPRIIYKPDDDSIFQSASVRHDSELNALAKEQQERISTIRETLSPVEREVFRLKFDEGCSIPKISLMLELTESRVRGILKGRLNEIKDRLAAAGVVDPTPIRVDG